ncbi:hypothetical protein GLI01_23520 [Gluconacetobacter liquefaciens]|uniref:DUF2824 family protein n=2 Tax=Gluconacetobacter TaxID=89583 RepID=A0A370G4K7_GLULI|nr:DUF2824 family protein [Gluconacetobacter liquefaciens]MBB2186483.1 DUF2824 family protein [Gluconacetobacter liquefaciens]RDI38150.1 uncharacterized protein DUF2824 [Gluconacetobacter liquefaciens]GBR09440.1 hypothetical protein AA0522_2327 [Gluconacetobacter liquefaciens NRIC 0522]GEB38317.1 hypothetical protein GLI01_23520 [Gluconacetobacter liquefaciens]
MIALPPIPGAALNDLDAINAVLTHPAVFGEVARLKDIGSGLIVSVPGVVVGFQEVRPRVHECHQAVIPEMRGRPALEIMRRVRDWWWATQPSDLMIAPIPEHKKPARFLMHLLGFQRIGPYRAVSNDGIEREYVAYQMERPQ